MHAAVRELPARSLDDGPVRREQRPGRDDHYSSRPVNTFPEDFMPAYLTSVPNVSTPCVTTNPCACPPPGPTWHYVPLQTSPTTTICFLAGDPGTPPNVTSGTATPVPALSTWATIAVVFALALIGLRRIR
jgi:hypothetical protein